MALFPSSSWLNLRQAHEVPPTAAGEASDNPSSWTPSLVYLKLFVTTVLLGDFCFLIVIALFAPSQASRAVGPSVLAAISAMAWVMLARGKTKAAINTLTYGVWAVVTGIAVFNGGLRTPIVFAYPLIILSVGLLVSARAALVVAAGTTLVIAALAMGEIGGLLPAHVPALVGMYGVVQGTICIVAALLIAAVVRAYQTRLTELGALGTSLTLRTRDLEENRTRLQQAQAVAKIGSWTYDVTTDVLGISSETCRIFDLKEGQDDMQRVFLSRIHPSDHSKMVQALEGARKGIEFDFEHRILVGGALHWIRQKAEIQRNEDGEPVCAVGIAQDITDRKAAQEQIQSLAFFDPLTQLPNRRLLMDRLEHAIAARARHKRNGALLFVDLDNFKVLNDTHGHFMGDQLLQQVAQRLSTCIREGDTVARLGGDEFVVMLDDLSEDRLEATTQADAVAKKILAALDQSYELGDHAHRNTASIGVTLFGEQPETIDEPLKRADLAMYQSKNAGRNAVHFFNPRMHTLMTERAALEKGLREALAHNQFTLHYQAQVTQAGDCIGSEALLRWQHPQRGFVSPAEFIPVAEETALILPLGHWVLETACSQLAVWATQPAMAHLTVAVNVSPRQFHQPDFVSQVLASLEQTGANAHRLKLELTEGLLVANIEDVITKMTALKAAGVGFSLDDFGTGYSSLAYLKRLPLEQLKIDQSFVRDILIDPNDAAIAKMVIVLAESLGLSVIAEGVETEAQRDFLAAQGCNAYQGYLFSRPLAAEGFDAFVASRPALLA